MPSRLAARPAALSRDSSSRRPAKSFRECNRWLRLLLWANDRATIQFIGDTERDLACGKCLCDFIIGKELARSMSGLEVDLHLQPQRIEALALNRVQHADEKLAAGQTGIGHKDDMNGRIVLEHGVFAAGRKFHKIYRKELVIIIGRHLAG